MTRAEHISALMEEYAQQRTRNEADQRARFEAAVARAPRIAALREESAALALGAMRGILSERSAEARAAAAQQMKRRGQAINAEIRALLKDAGLPENALEPRFRCEKCRDTGTVGDAPARFCECFEARLRLRMHEDGSMAGVDEQNFAAFDPQFIPEADGQRAQLLAARQVCENFADTFPDTRYRVLLLSGGTGLGKTFLLNCIFERVISRGYSAVRVTAFRMFEAMRARHMGGDAIDAFGSLLEAPLLLIDDLGSEPMMKNITVEYLFTLLNERAAAKRRTVVATNLTPGQLNACYGERVAARLLDKTCCGAMLLKGKDLRKQ